MTVRSVPIGASALRPTPLRCRRRSIEAGSSGPQVRLMESLKSLLVGALVLYGFVVAGMYLYQRRLVFDLRPSRVAPADAGFPEAQEHVLATDDGEHIVTWLRPPADA